MPPSCCSGVENGKNEMIRCFKSLIGVWVKVGAVKFKA